MAHYAILNSNNIVENVIVVSNDIANTEQAGINFIKETFNDQNLKVIKTSYNTLGGIHYGDNNQPDNGVPLRANYAGLNYIYDPINDVFYAPRPVDSYGVTCNSWIISAPSWIWENPVKAPTTGGPYLWNEDTLSFIPKNN